MADGQARIIVGASPVAADRRHTYLLFEHSDGSQTVVRGGPDARAEGNDLANFSKSTLWGSDQFGKIVVDAAPYIAPYAAVYQQQPDGSVAPIPAVHADLNDTMLKRDAQGKPIIRQEVAPDWPFPGEKHEQITVWTGSDQQLERKLEAALAAGQQINDAQLEYAPLYNNSNGVTSTLLKSADVRAQLPLGSDGQAVTAPNFGQDLYQDVGVGGLRSGYRFDGKQWLDGDDRKIQPPQSGQPTIPLGPTEQPARGSFDSSRTQPDGLHHGGPSDIRAPSHPENPRFEQAYAGVIGIDHERGRSPDQISERLAAALAVQSKADGLEAIRCVVMNKEGTRAFAVDNADPAAPWAKRTSVEVAAAIQQPVEASNEKLEQLTQRMAVQQQDSTLVQDDPGRSAPKMA